MSLIAQRITLSKKIGAIKEEIGLPIRNYQVEKQVYARADAYADEFTFDHQFAHDLMSLMIAKSVSVQKPELGITQTLAAESYRCLILGGGGKMGRWVRDFLLTSGHQVEVVDPVLEPSKGTYTTLPADLSVYHIIFVATPLETMPEVLTDLLSFEPKGLIVEMASLKSGITDIILQASKTGMHIVPIHPMFGPESHNLDGRNLLLCTIENINMEDISIIKSLFADTAVNIVMTNFTDHDRYMAYTLGLAHLINLIMGDVLEHSGIDFKEIMQFASTTFWNQYITTKEVFMENPNLYHAIQHVNANRDALYGQVRESLAKIAQLTQTEDHTGFSGMVGQVRAYFGS